MCGLAGVAWRDAARLPDPEILRAMGAALAHRGPDDSGEYAAPGIGLVSRRLAIMDPSPAGRMPMASDDGQVVLVFNGEIYNHVELREEMKRRGVRFRSQSDTEVLLRLYLHEGADALHRLIGMFAFALWDGRRRALLLARDRLGVKPLRYRIAADGIRFASEVGGLLAEPGFAPEPDPEALHHLLALRFVPHPRSIHAGVEQLPPGHLLLYEGGRARLQRYWSLPEPGNAGPRRLDDLRERYRALMDDAVRLRLRSDVPFALLLSGGVDSAAVAYHMRRNRTRAFKAFTVGFGEGDYDERPRAREVARHFGIEHHTLEVSPMALDELGAIVAHMQEPFADPSVVPSWLLAREVSRHVKVALVGDGGDELFGGYDRYRAHLLAERFGWLPGLVSRTPFYALLEAVSSERSRRNLPGRLRRLLEGWELPARERNALWMANPGARRIARLYQPDFAARVGGSDPTRGLGRLPNSWGARDLIGLLLRADQETFLPDDLLLKADVTSMAFGVELRSPFLDHRVVEFAAGLPPQLKVRTRGGKWFLRRVYRSHMPESVLKAKKAGFGLPLDHWFRGDLYGVAADLLLGTGAESRANLKRDAVAAVLAIHRSGQRNYDEMIWTLLVLEIWLRDLKRRRTREAA
ncbi:MAG TPA: asparagine synthase (glutamine-hydrolyzing) [Candidatus Polarisedimenticolia bacterium]|nr:asparagine synthase (glutamine-hydrolyzing) [Candidatus Polarisedimenticolia bacterium]